jgi:hypothetical protein
MRLKLALTLTAVAVIGLATPILAQQPGQGGRGRGGGGFGGGGMGFGFMGRMQLLRIPEVRKELELADEQIAAIDKANEEIQAKYPGFGGRGGPGGGGTPGGDGQKGRRGRGNDGAFQAVPTDWYFIQAQQGQAQQGQGQQGRGRGGPQLTDEQRAEFEKQRQERTKEENAKLGEILLPHQLRRLTEIYVQIAGVNALQDEEVSKDLGLTDAQKTKLAEVRRQNQEAFGTLMREQFGGGGGGDPEAARAKRDELQKANDAKVLAVLTADQQKKFDELKGKKFDMPEGAGRRGGGPGGQGGTRGRGGNQNN